MAKDPHATDPHYRRLRAIVDALPDTAEKRPWGDEPHWTVAGKIFCGWGRDADGRSGIGVKLEKPMQAMLVASDPRFKVAKYVGAHGWVDMTLDEAPDWGEVEALILGSYLLIAPKKLAAQVAGGAAAPPPRAKTKATAKAAKAPRKASPRGASSAPARRKPATSRTRR